MVRYKVFISVLVLVLVLAACSTPSEELSTQYQEFGMTMPEETIDGQFAKLGQTLSGFGGFFYDEKGQLSVVLTEEHSLEEVREQIAGVFGKEMFQRAATERNKLADTDGLATITLVKGNYTVLELLKWRDQAVDILSVKGVVSLDMNETQNRVVVGHTKDANLEELQTFIQKRELPLEAFIFEVQSPITPMQGTVRDIFRPVPGGVQINDGRGTCTLGFNAVRNGVEGFVTNAHCIASTNTTFYQPAWPQVVAYNAFTPSAFANGACPTFRICFYSDSGFVSYMTRDLLGFPIRLPETLSLARPVLWNGRLDLPFSSARFSILSSRSYPISGEELDKVGRTTGWTYGVVTGTCVHTNVSGTNTTQLCQDHVTRRAHQSFVISSFGDSGSPVFFWNGSTGATMVGLLWGGNNNDVFVLSPLGNITLPRELGAITLGGNTSNGGNGSGNDDPGCPPLTGSQSCQ